MTIDESAFDRVANETLEGLMETIDAALGDRMDVDLEGGILTIDLNDGGRYVINKHAPNRQIWMSSPVGGATHYDYGPDAQWVDTRGGRALLSVLQDELAKATGTRVELS